MANTIQLYQFTNKPTPVTADLVYLADSANSYDEVQSTLGQVLAAIPSLYFLWNSATSSPVTGAVENGYIINNAGQTTVNLPATAAVGQRVSIVGQGAGGWIVQANTGQTIHIGNVVSSSGGTATSSNQYDSLNLICIVANTIWSAVGGPQGNITLA
jgi:hypothetical protein